MKKASVDLVFLIASANTGSRSGKSTVAEAMMKRVLEHHTYSYIYPRILEFSYPLKWMCANVLGLDDAHICGDKKQEPTDISIAGFAENASSRQIMQYLGTDIFRDKFGYDVWVKQADREIKKFSKEVEIYGKTCSSFVFIPDWRFENEHKYLEEQGHTVIKINVDRPDNTIGVTAHKSDNSLSESLKHMDYTVTNDTSLNDLKEAAYFIMDDILEKHGLISTVSCC